MSSEIITSNDLRAILNEVLPYQEEEPNNLSAWVDLSSYNSSSNTYTFPSDGYVFTYNASNNTSYLTLLGATDGGSAVAIGAQNSRHSMFVRKGMKCYVAGTFSAVRFSALY